MAVRLVCSVILCVAYVLQLHVFYDMDGETRVEQDLTSTTFSEVYTYLGLQTT